jgi:hypothetical protein
LLLLSARLEANDQCVDAIRFTDGNKRLPFADPEPLCLARPSLVLAHWIVIITPSGLPPCGNPDNSTGTRIAASEPREAASYEIEVPVRGYFSLCCRVRALETRTTLTVRIEDRRRPCAGAFSTHGTGVSPLLGRIALDAWTRQAHGHPRPLRRCGWRSTCRMRPGGGMRQPVMCKGELTAHDFRPVRRGASRKNL